MQTIVGLIIVALGMMHFVDRDRVGPAVRSYFFGSPATATGRGLLAVLEVTLGFVVLFTA